MTWDGILDLLYPPRCVFCRRPVPSGEAVCAACDKLLPRVGTAVQGEKLVHIAGVYAPFFYEDTVRDSLRRCKFDGQNSYPKKYAYFIAKCIDENAVSCDIITWVPLSRRRLRSRGFDQARLIAEAVGRTEHIACVRLLEKVRHTPAQSGMKSAEQRRLNAAGAYRAVNTDTLRGKRILLIDDIITTGSTVSECARVLLAAGAQEVMAAAVARGHR